MKPPADILILSNGPGEILTWVRPAVKQLRRYIPHARLSLVLSPCAHASGKEADIARERLELDRVQGAEHFWPFLLSGTTAEDWGWGPFGVVLFLGGDQFFALQLGRKLGYRVVVYAEWEARWQRWVDVFAVRTESIAAKAARRWQSKMYVVGDLMADGVTTSPLREPSLLPVTDVNLNTPTEPLGEQDTTRPEPLAGGDSATLPVSITPSLPWLWQPVNSRERSAFQIGLLPGSKPAKLSLGVPLMLAVADRLREALPAARFAIPLAPTLDLKEIAEYASVVNNWDMATVYGTSAVLEEGGNTMQFSTPFGTTISLWREFPSYDLLANCDICLTTVGANTAELGRLGIPMVVILPTNKLDAMRSWDGLLGLIVRLPVVGTLLARFVNWYVLRFVRFLAWPNIWAQRRIVPELRGHLTPQTIADVVCQILLDREHYNQMHANLEQWREEPGAAEAIAQIVAAQLEDAGAL
ncbi:MAG: hypothetical protein AAF268_00610 [Cyanobacteria bacterium P01_A01_bin.3]